MHRNIKHSIAVDCFMNEQRMEAHLTHFKKFINVLKEMNGIHKDAQVPLQESEDGTIVSGLIGSMIYPGNEVALVGFNHCPTQRVLILGLETTPDQPVCYLSDDNKII